MYAYCVREFSKKTAVSHDRAGSGRPLSAYVKNFKSNYDKKTFMPKQNYFNVSVSQRTPLVCECK